VRLLAMDNPKVTDEEIRKIGPILQRLMWSDSDTREKIQQYGVDVLPINFYSNTPSIQEIKNSYEYLEETPPYLDAGIFENDILKSTIDDLMDFSTEFNPKKHGNEEDPSEFFWENSQFSWSDAMSYYCFIRMLKPQTIIEIGSGFSTLVAVDAIRKNGCGSIVCIEPFPRPFLQNLHHVSIIEKRAQDISRYDLNNLLSEDGILFIDSTHTVKSGSDCLHIYLRLLPTIEKNIFVHSHDVFLPFGLPMNWLLERQIFWTEQYLLLGFLIDNPKATVLFGSAYNKEKNEDKLLRLMGGKCAHGGGSIWFKYDGRR
jgi:hypothetical protein